MIGITYYDFEDFVAKCDEVKSIYNYYLISNYKNHRSNCLKRHILREYIYSKQMSTKKKDRIWEYLNGDIEKDILNKILGAMINKQEKKRK